MKYRVNDRVRIKSLDWYNENKDEYGYINCGSRAFFTKMSDWCGKIVTIKEVCKPNYYRLKEYDFDWTDEMIEGLVEEEVGLVDNFSSRWVNEFNLPNGYIFKDENGNVISTQKIVLEKKKKEYPKTYKECCKILYIDSGCLLASYNIGFWKYELLNSLQKLLICRDAYWKIAGEDMKLGKPWESDNDYSSPPKYIISCYFGDIIKEKYCGQYNKLLSFPTEEMRDAFYENFKEEIETVKELL